MVYDVDTTYGLDHVHTRDDRCKYTIPPLTCLIATHPSGRESIDQ